MEARAEEMAPARVLQNENKETMKPYPQDKMQILDRIAAEYKTPAGSIDWSLAMKEHADWRARIGWDNPKLKQRAYNAMTRIRKHGGKLAAAPLAVVEPVPPATPFRNPQWSPARKAKLRATLAARRNGNGKAGPPRHAPATAEGAGMAIHTCPKCQCTWAELPVHPFNPALIQTAFNIMQRNA